MSKYTALGMRAGTPRPLLPEDELTAPNIESTGRVTLGSWHREAADAVAINPKNSSVVIVAPGLFGTSITDIFGGHPGRVLIVMCDPFASSALNLDSKGGSPGSAILQSTLVLPGECVVLIYIEHDAEAQSGWQIVSRSMPQVDLATAAATGILPASKGGTGVTGLPLLMAQLDDLAATWTQPQIYNCAISEGAIATPSAFTGNQNNLSVAATTLMWRLSSTLAINLTGVSGANPNRVIRIINVGTFTITLTHDATSTAANRFLCPGSTNFALSPNKCVTLWYDGISTRWRIIG